MRLRRVEGLEAEDAARVVEVTVAPLVVRDGEEDIEAERGGRPEACLDHPRDVALTAPDREVAPRARPALVRDVTHAPAEMRAAAGVGGVTRDGPAPLLARP